MRDVHFCPYEDVVGIAHSNGFSSILVPGNTQETPSFLDPSFLDPVTFSTSHRHMAVSVCLVPVCLCVSVGLRLCACACVCVCVCLCESV